MLDGIKNKLGFGNDQGYDNDYYDDYDAYADNFDGYSTSDDEGGAREEGYSSYSPVTTRNAGTNRSRRSSYTDQAASSLGERRKASAAHPPLVSLDDVRASTQVPDSLSRDPLPARHRSAGGFGRNSVGRASDFTLSGAEVDGGSQGPSSSDPGATADLGGAVSGSHTAGYDSLFESSSAHAPSQTSSKPVASAVGIGTHDPSASSDSRNMAAGAYDPYQAYEGAGSSTHRPTRNVIVISPNAYGEVEGVARSLKAGDAVVLSLRNTPSQLSKRILDFSFGVASALDASVDCIADKVFAVTRSSVLSDAECTKLRSQGVI